MAKDAQIPVYSPPAPGEPGRQSTLGPTLVCAGQITADEDLTIRGGYQGSLKLNGRRLSIEPTASVEADVEAGSVQVQGSLTGNIRATGMVSLSSEARMKGDIVAARVTIQEGAQFRGGIKILKS
jgi:cytoskeletal protein CcmA (bactofilin family)